MKNTVRFGLLGASQILKNQHMRALKAAENAEVAGIASRRIEKAREYADYLGIDHVYSSYEEMLEDPSIDAVLITLPMKLHCEWIIKAANAGKHVLCEKPMVLTVEEGERVLNAARNNRVIVTEAFTHLYHSQIKTVKDIIDSGRIGEIRMVRSEILYPTLDWENDTRANVDLGGCVLIEAGCYCVNTIRYFMQEEPIEVKGFAAYRNNGELMTSFTGIMKFSKERIGYMATSMETEVRICCDIIGTKGRIEIPSLFAGEKIYIMVTNEEAQEIIFKNENRFQKQVEYFSECILKGTKPLISLEDSINNIRTLIALREDAEKNKII